MKILYVSQESFHGLLQHYPKVLNHVSSQQRAKMIERIDIYDVMASAASYFQRDIVMEDNRLYMHHSITEESYCIECREDCVLFDNEDNPFIGLLKRKYRSFFIKDFDLT